MFKYVFMPFNVLYCITLLYYIIKAMFYHGPIKMNLNLNLNVKVYSIPAYWGTWDPTRWHRRKYFDKQKNPQNLPNSACPDFPEFCPNHYTLKYFLGHCPPPPPHLWHLYRVAHKKRNSRFFFFRILLWSTVIFFSPRWIEHLFLIIITPRSSDLVENFLFYE